MNFKKYDKFNIKSHSGGYMVSRKDGKALHVFQGMYDWGVRREEWWSSMGPASGPSTKYYKGGERGTVDRSLSGQKKLFVPKDAIYDFMSHNVYLLKKEGEAKVEKKIFHFSFSELRTKAILAKQTRQELIPGIFIRCDDNVNPRRMASSFELVKYIKFESDLEFNIHADIDMHIELL